MTAADTSADDHDIFQLGRQQRTETDVVWIDFFHDDARFALFAAVDIDIMPDGENGIRVKIAVKTILITDPCIAEDTA